MDGCAHGVVFADAWKHCQQVAGAPGRGLVGPLDIDLRANIIAYGELTQATYDGFNQEERSPNCGACVWGYADLLASSGAAAAGSYAVTKFIYATSALPVPKAFLVLPLPELLPESWSRESNWMGYVAVATDDGAGEARHPRRVARDDEEPRVGQRLRLHARVRRAGAGLRSGRESGRHGAQGVPVRVQVLEEVSRLMALYKDEPPCPVTAFVYASPRVGDGNFRSAFASFPDLRALHVKNAGDVVPLYPPLGYVDVAVPLPIDTGRSPYLRQPETIPTRHNLECYLHGVAGEQGSAGGFKLEVDRDVALVNKGEDALKSKYPVPADWWVAKNKFMVKGADGSWALQDFEQI
ncbi:phospholipase A1-II 7-like [Panicum miliaceum]|uniref:Phospholipase A1 n=1 Tax=Panicum miliaceum TaxID=4540 RepID=A0A3L6SW10_PANMI|nr:phospholipase A1-II 7-like [Panicum miliaceum]